MCAASIRRQWMSTWCTVLPHPCTASMRHHILFMLKCSNSQMLCCNLPSTSCLCHLIYHLREEEKEASQCYLQFLSAHKHSKVICHHQLVLSSATLSHLTDTWHIIIRVIFCHGQFSAADAVDKVRLVLHCHWMLSFSHLLTASVDFTLLHFAQHNGRHWKQQHDTLWFDEFLGGCANSLSCSKCCRSLHQSSCVAVAITDCLMIKLVCNFCVTLIF